MTKEKLTFSSILAMMGAILIGFGVLWLIAQNWHSIPAVLKIIILLVATSSAFFGATWMQLRDYKIIARALKLLGGILYTAGVFLIGQIFHLSTSSQSVAHHFLFIFVGVLIFAYTLKSEELLLLGLIEFLIWIGVQYFTLTEHAGIMMVILLFLVLFFYGVSQMHTKVFRKIFLFWSAFYFLLVAYLLSFQLLIPSLWLEESLPTSALIFAVAIIVLSMGSVLAPPRTKEKGILIILIVLFICFIGTTYLVKDVSGRCTRVSCYQFENATSCMGSPYVECLWKASTVTPRGNEVSIDSSEQISKGYCMEKTCYNMHNKDDCTSMQECSWFNTSAEHGYCENTVNNPVFPEDTCNEFNSKESCGAGCIWQKGMYQTKNPHITIWLVWIFANILFLAAILVVLGYGTKTKSSALINLGIIFFALGIFTRYLGFVIDFWGYTSLSILFIIGGGILLLGGWGIEKWRKKLLKTAKKH